MIILDLENSNQQYIKQTAKLLQNCFEGAWDNFDCAIEEVKNSIDQQKISRVAIDEKNEVIGWISGNQQYNGNVWELHPLVVAKAWQRKGIGSALVHDFEEIVRSRGGITIFLGTDDEHNATTLGGIDIYPGLLENLKNINNLRRHPYEFYQKLGYQIVGVIPDANGFGKPDILMAKRILDIRA